MRLPADSRRIEQRSMASGVGERSNSPAAWHCDRAAANCSRTVAADAIRLQSGFAAGGKHIRDHGPAGGGGIDAVLALPILIRKGLYTAGAIALKGGESLGEPAQRARKLDAVT